MKFPRKEAKALLTWMQEQMSGETATEWTYGNEHDRMAECADLVGMLIRQESAENRINALFEELVPASGKADTVAGEIIRAVSRIAYRNYNDGDHIGIGYGNETCNPAARYLGEVAGDCVKQAIVNMWGVGDDSRYDNAVEALEEAVLEYLEQHPELKTTVNSEDMWDYRNDLEDRDVPEDDEDDYCEDEEDWE